MTAASSVTTGIVSTRTTTPTKRRMSSSGCSSVLGTAAATSSTTVATAAPVTTRPERSRPPARTNIHASRTMAITGRWRSSAGEQCGGGAVECGALIGNSLPVAQNHFPVGVRGHSSLVGDQ